MATASRETQPRYREVIGKMLGGGKTLGDGGPRIIINPINTTLFCGYGILFLKGSNMGGGPKQLAAR